MSKYLNRVNVHVKQTGALELINNQCHISKIKIIIYSIEKYFFFLLFIYLYSKNNFNLKNIKSILFVFLNCDVKIVLNCDLFGNLF